jgi:microcompartment protein CcmK/EutM
VTFPLRALPVRGSRDETADHLQCIGDAAVVARELHGAGIGEELLLATDRRLDEAGAEGADPADDQQAETEYGQRGAAFAALAVAASHAVGAGAQEKVSDVADEGDALEQRREADTQAHVAVQDVR